MNEAGNRTFESALERPRQSSTLRLRVCRHAEHIHLSLGEPEREMLADALKSLKQGVSRRLIGDAEHFWQKRYSLSHAILLWMALEQNIHVLY